MAMAPPPDRTLTQRSGPDGLSVEDQLRDIRVQVLGLQKLISFLGSGAYSYADFAAAASQNVQSIEDAVPQLKFDEYPDAITDIQITWQTMMASPILKQIGDPTHPPDPQAIPGQIQILNDLCKHAVFLIGYLTIPRRLNDWLSKAPFGYYIPFHQVFEDEVPDQADRTKLLQEISWAPRVLRGGLVDVTSGLVYKYSTSQSVRVLSLLAVLLALAISVLAIIFACNPPWGRPDGWPYSPQNVTDLLGAYFALLLGIIVHLGVGMAKRSQMQDQLPPVYAPTEILARVNAQLGKILYRLFLALVALFGMVGIFGLSQAIPYTAFLTGYSLDSVIELVGTTLDSQSSARIDSLRQQLGLK